MVRPERILRIGIKVEGNRLTWVYLENGRSNSVCVVGREVAKTPALM